MNFSTAFPLFSRQEAKFAQIAQRYPKIAAKTAKFDHKKPGTLLAMYKTKAENHFGTKQEEEPT